jgi:hypothetical protein
MKLSFSKCQMASKVCLISHWHMNTGSMLKVETIISSNDDTINCVTYLLSLGTVYITKFNIKLKKYEVRIICNSPKFVSRIKTTMCWSYKKNAYKKATKISIRIQISKNENLR